MTERNDGTEVTHCEVCGEALSANDEICEMYLSKHPWRHQGATEKGLSEHKIGHVIHLQEGYELA